MEHGDPSITIRYVQLALDALRDASGSIPLLIEAARNSRQAEGGAIMRTKQLSWSVGLL